MSNQSIGVILTELIKHDYKSDEYQQAVLAFGELLPSVGWKALEYYTSYYTDNFVIGEIAGNQTRRLVFSKHSQFVDCCDWVLGLDQADNIGGFFEHIISSYFEPVSSIRDVLTGNSDYPEWGTLDEVQEELLRLHEVETSIATMRRRKDDDIRVQVTLHSLRLGQTAVVDGCGQHWRAQARGVDIATNKNQSAFYVLLDAMKRFSKKL